MARPAVAAGATDPPVAAIAAPEPAASAAAAVATATLKVSFAGCLCLCSWDVMDGGKMHLWSACDAHGFHPGGCDHVLGVTGQWRDDVSAGQGGVLRGSNHRDTGCFRSPRVPNNGD